jgi:hypothetical protein
MPCPYDTDGDGDCGQRGCPKCGGGPNPYKEWSPYHVLNLEHADFKPVSPPASLLSLNELIRKLLRKATAFKWN